MISKVRKKPKKEYLPIAERLQTLRKKANLSQERLAEMLEVSREAVGFWERAISIPTTDNILKLCKLYGCDADFILCRIDNRTHDLKFIHEQTGLSEIAISSLESWFSEDNQHKKWPEYLSRLIENPDFSDLMSCIAELLELRDATNAFLKANNMKMATKTIELTTVNRWQAEHIFTDIVSSIIKLNGGEQ